MGSFETVTHCIGNYACHSGCDGCIYDQECIQITLEADGYYDTLCSLWYDMEAMEEDAWEYAYDCCA